MRKYSHILALYYPENLQQNQDNGYGNGTSGYRYFGPHILAGLKIVEQSTLLAQQSCGTSHAYHFPTLASRHKYIFNNFQLLVSNY